MWDVFQKWWFVPASTTPWIQTALETVRDFKHNIGAMNETCHRSFVYRTVHHCDSWRIRDQLDVANYYVLFHFFCAQHISDINTSIIRSLRLFYCITTLVVCSCFNVRWSFGVAGLGWYPCSRLRPATRIPPQPSHTETPTHIETRTHDQCGDTIEKSQAPDDGCINVRNMLSIKEVK